jgi:hypothetical protein
LFMTRMTPNAKPLEMMRRTKRAMVLSFGAPGLAGNRCPYDSVDGGAPKRGGPTMWLGVGMVGWVGSAGAMRLV